MFLFLLVSEALVWLVHVLFLDRFSSFSVSQTRYISSVKYIFMSDKRLVPCFLMFLYFVAIRLLR